MKIDSNVVKLFKSLCQAVKKTKEQRAKIKEIWMAMKSQKDGSYGLYTVQTRTGDKRRKNYKVVILAESKKAA